MTREEHLKWCKERAKGYLDRGDVIGAFASFSSDMSKHNELCNHVALPLGMQMMLNGRLGSTREMRNWIMGFN